MNVVLFGATGMIGQRILNELIAREHNVKVVARNPEKITTNGNVSAVKGDVMDAESVAAAAKGADAVISAYGPGAAALADPYKLMEDSTRSLIAGVKEAEVPRLMMVGGAGSLMVGPGLDLIDSGHLPDEWKPIAIAHRDVLKILGESDVNWTSLAPAAFIQPGERTGKFRLGTDTLITDGEGNSRISAEDYAVAMVDELEKPQHVRQRFTVAY